VKPWKDWTIGERQELLSEIFTQAPGNFTDYLIIAHTYTNNMTQTVYEAAPLYPGEPPAVSFDSMIQWYLATAMADLAQKRLQLEELDKEAEQ
jgi:hypothetical protein